MTGRQGRDGKMNESILLDLSVAEFVDDDAAARVIFGGPERIGKRAHACVQARSIGAEGKTREQRLLAHASDRAIVRKILQLACLGIEHGERLHVLRFECAVAGVDRHHVPGVGRSGHRHGQAVDLLRRAWHGLRELLACRKIVCLGDELASKKGRG